MTQTTTRDTLTRPEQIILISLQIAMAIMVVWMVA